MNIFKSQATRERMIKLAECMAKDERIDYVVYKRNGIYNFMIKTEADILKINYVYVAKGL